MKVGVEPEASTDKEGEVREEKKREGREGERERRREIGGKKGSSTSVTRGNTERFSTLYIKIIPFE